MRKEDLFLKDILESIENIEKFMKNISKEYFLKNREKQNAVIREIEIIGEAVKNISDETRKKYSEVEWKNIAGTRDIFIHGYFQVNLERVWGIIKKDIPNLKQKIQNIKKESEKELRKKD